MARAELRANETQRETVRKELHDHVDALINAWGQLEQQAREMGRGYPSGGEGGGENQGTLVERVALSDAFDPATAASEWLAEFSEFRALGKNLYGKLKRVLPVDPSSVERGRVNTVDLCTECNLPAPKVKRLDGKPYHHPESGESCWWTAYNRTRGRRGA